MRSLVVPFVVALAGCAGAKTTTPEPAAPEPAAAPAPAPAPAPAATPAASEVVGAFTVQPLYHATLRVDVGGQVWVIDPWTKAPLDGIKADVVLITDIHPDHLDPAALDAVRKEGTIVVAPAAVVDAGTQVDVVLANGETRDVGAAKVTAVPMYNRVRGPEAGKLFHDKGRGNGYVVDVGGDRLYVAGDTECTDEMKALDHIHVAFVPMNLPYTMPPDEAAACVAAFEPAILYPYHYGDSDLSGVAAAVGDGVDVRLREWYPGGRPF